MKKTNPLFILLLTYIVGLIVLFTIAICLSGCSAQRRFDNIIRQHPDIGYSWCANKFNDNVIPVYIPGDSVRIMDTIRVDCGDSVVVRSVDKIVKVPVIREIFRVDTLRYDCTSFQAELALSRSSNDSLTKVVNQTEIKAEKAKSRANITLYILIGFVVLVALMIYLIFRGIINLKTILK